MIIEIEIGVLIALNAAAILAPRKPRLELPAVFHDAVATAGSQPFTENASKTTAPTLPRSAYSSDGFHPLEIVKMTGDKLLHIGFRHDGHPDINAARNTPGLAIRHADGRIERGQQ
jgi:hypothetical protein